MLEFGMKYLHFYVTLHIFTLSVQGLSVTQSPEKVTFGSPVTITCNIGTITQEVKWLREGSDYFECSKPYGAGICHKFTATQQNHHFYDFNIEKGTAQVKIQSVDANENDGTWTCKHGDSVVGEMAINVTSKPVITFTGIANDKENTNIINVDEGDEVELECKVNGDQPVQKITILGSGREPSSNESTSSLSWPIKARCSDHEFRCEASNGYGSAEPATLLLHVTCKGGPLKLTNDHKITTVPNVGSNATFVVTFVGYPPPNVTWTRKIADEDYIEMTSYRNTKEEFHNKATLTIHNVHMEDGGKYAAEIQRGMRTIND